MKANFSVKDKVFAITGGAGILCGEMARQLVEHGAKVAVIDLFGDKAQALAGELNAKGVEASEAFGFACDVTDKESVEACCAAVFERFGRVDVLVNGAGGNRADANTSPERPFFDVPKQALEGVFNLNLMGTVLPSQVFGKAMAAQGSGNIINVCSMSGIRPLTNVMGYSAAKAAVANFTQWLAAWFCLNVSKDIRVNAIAPGFLLTDQNRGLLTDPATGAPTPRSAHIIQQTPMGRYGEPEELVGAIIFLASEASSFITGAVIPIDGGFSVYSI
jgi:NAD(P)-dependent dehydrogenase (short-subunit alcohol dehydrogenase family)